MEALATRSCPTLCNPIDCSLPGSSVHGILQKRKLEWVAISSSRGSSQPRDQTRVSCASYFGVFRQPFSGLPSPRTGVRATARELIRWISQGTVDYWKSEHYQLPRWLSGEEPACQCRRCRKWQFNPWVGKIPWRRKWQLTSVFLPGESHGQRSLVGYSPWGRKESDTTEKT